MNTGVHEQNQGQGMASDSWAGDQGEKWNTWVDQFEGMIGPAGEAAIGFAGFHLGEQVIDIGCGAGITSLQIAPLVGPEGHVTGLDINEALIETSRGRAARAGVDNVDFVVGDAARIRLEREYDHLFSRFGLMFFEEPQAAFRNMRDFLRPDGRLSFVCWGPPTDNPWVFELMSVVGEYVDLPEPQPHAPGPFAFADRDYLGDILHQAGFRNVEIQSWSGDQLMGGPGATPARAARFIMAATFIGEAVQDRPESVQREVEQALARTLARHQRADDIVFKGATWLVRGVRD